MSRKIIQFGDTFTDGIFVFTPFEEEEDYADEVSPSLLELSFNDGAFRARGFDQSRKPTKTITKRFILNDTVLKNLVIKNKQSLLGTNITPTKQSYLSDFIDYLYRTLRGGVKRLYMMTEDGSLRWTYAEAVTIPFVKTFSDAKPWQAFSIDFILHDPYWYEVGDGYTFLFTKDNLPFINLIDPCKPSDHMPDYMIERDGRLDTSFCTYNGAIVYNPDWAGYTPFCLGGDCAVDPSTYHFGPMIYQVSGDTIFDVCVTGSAGSTRPQVFFQGEFVNPRVENTDSGYYLEYAGNLGSGDYLWIDTNSTINGEIEDMNYLTNISGFDINSVTINNNGFFDMQAGTNNFMVQGGTSLAEFRLNFFNKYHN